MADENEVHEVVQGDGYAVANVDALGEGPGFRKVRRELGVTAFGVNAIEIPPGYATGRHYHDEQEELYFVHRGRVRITFNDDSDHELGPGWREWTPPPCGRSRTWGTSPRSTWWPAARTATWVATASCPRARRAASARPAARAESELTCERPADASP